MSEAKRNRAANFTNSEKNLLVDIVSQYKTIVENKKTDNKSVKLKEETWLKIKNIYIAKSGNERSVNSLKICWDNLKQKCRKSQTELKLDLPQTCFAKIKSDNTEDLLTEKVKEILNASSDEPQHDDEWEPVSKEDISDFISSIKVNYLLDNVKEETPTPNLIKLSSIYSVQKEKNADVEEDLKDDESCNEDNTETETPIESKRRKLNFTPSKSTSISPQEKFWEEKRSLISLAKEFLLAEEERKKEIHKLEIEERKFKIKILKLQMKN